MQTSKHNAYSSPSLKKRQVNDSHFILNPSNFKLHVIATQMPKVFCISRALVSNVA